MRERISERERASEREGKNEGERGRARVLESVGEGRGVE